MSGADYAQVRLSLPIRGPWEDEAALDDRSRMYAQLWRPLLAEGLIGSGQTERAAVVLAQLQADSGRGIPSGQHLREMRRARTAAAAAPHQQQRLPAAA